MVAWVDVLAAGLAWAVVGLYVARLLHLGRYLPSLREGRDPDAEAGCDQ